MTETFGGLSDRSRIGLFAAAATAFTAAVGLLEPATGNIPLGIIGLLAVSLLLVLFSLGSPPVRR